MTPVELLEEIKKDYLAKFENDPAINRVCTVMINEFKARILKFDLPVVVKSVKENTKKPLTNGSNEDSIKAFWKP